ncbi:MAG: hypothetical protein HY893_06540 [Deltaproteobacteria bacterium]|nr:hypothetical protein [Deltaproteobacteria bacterium]
MELNVEAYRGRLDEVLQKHGLPAASLELVDDFGGEARVTKCFKIQKKICLKKVITEEERGWILAWLYQFEEDQTGLLKDDWTFLKHTLLREICHILYRYKDDYECAKWAFYELKG